MEKVIFAWYSSGYDWETSILAESIRKFAGILSSSPIWVFVPKSTNDISIKLRKKLLSLKVKIFPFTVTSEILKFPFAGKVLAASVAESLGKKETEILAWLSSNTLIVNEPKKFLLDGDIALGYRPVHHTLIGSIYEKPIDSFWTLIYRECKVPEEKIFPMKTHVDSNIIRPYFNAGCLIVKPEKAILQTWWHFFKNIHQKPEFKDFYQQDQLYRIFIHQAVLTGTILLKLEIQEIEELPFSYNYPLHLYFDSLPEFRPPHMNDLITVRYEEIEILNTFPLFNPTFKSWLTNIL